MKKFILFMILSIVSSAYLTQELSTEEMKLYNNIMEYRKVKNLPSIPLSKSLTFVAQTHVKDLAVNSPDQKSNCNMHSWSNKGKWTSCCYTSNHARAKCMWKKPSELTSYKGNGFEISHGSPGNPNYVASAESALNGWKGSSGHNAVMVNEGIWKNSNWKAIGVGIYKNYAVVWFGKEEDKN
jgi:uncharacterized protein YkwD